MLMSHIGILHSYLIKRNAQNQYDVNEYGCLLQLCKMFLQVEKTSVCLIPQTTLENSAKTAVEKHSRFRVVWLVEKVCWEERRI